MLGKRSRERMEELRAELLDGLAASGTEERVATALWETLVAAFWLSASKSHAACYALLGYRAAGLKAHHPEAFAAGLHGGGS